MNATAVEFSHWLSGRAQHVERVLARVLPQEDLVPTRLHQAMRYSVLGGGKRVRAALVFAAAQACAGASSAQQQAQSALAQDYAAAAVELVHAYSLVHDDLPCMDDDVLRRGRPTVHVQYDEATALLAGDALQPLAFDLLAQMPIAPELIVQATRDLARAAGSLGMAGGQAIDLDSVGKTLTQPALQQMHVLKTGALLGASVSLGGLAGGANAVQREALTAYSDAIGLAFQVIDDVLDVTADSAKLGKTVGKDAIANKPTYVTLMGLTQARDFAAHLHQQALAALHPFGASASLLAGLADFIVLRDH
jgi:farnesyl diphosphate synthase